MASPGGYSSGNPSGINSPSVHSGVKRLSAEDRQRLANMLRALQLQQQAHAEAQPPASAEASRPAEGGAERPAEAGAERGADMAVDAPACAQRGEWERQGRDMAGVNGEAAGTWGDSPSSSSSPPPGGAMSRKDILEIVRKHSGALVRPAASRDGAGAEAAQTALMMDRQYWREMADLFFVRGVQLRGDAIQDGSFRDVVFFVRDESPAATPRQADGVGEGAKGVSGRGEGEEAVERRRPYFARRRQSSLGEILGGSGESIDWRRTFYLNLICHTDYSLTIAVCRWPLMSSPHAIPPFHLLMPSPHPISSCHPPIPSPHAIPPSHLLMLSFHAIPRAILPPPGDEESIRLPQ
ncbi:unnamed protein product [Closterium sp. Yama58-4]|nr:unnamed protein product [Closterium sp. Yama58-4]